jgi:hypothetical protein
MFAWGIHHTNSTYYQFYSMLEALGFLNFLALSAQQVGEVHTWLMGCSHNCEGGGAFSGHGLCGLCERMGSS